MARHGARRRPGPLLAASLVLLLASALAGCGSSSDSDSPPADTEPAPPVEITPAPPTEEAVTTGGTTTFRYDTFGPLRRGGGGQLRFPERGGGCGQRDSELDP